MFRKHFSQESRDYLTALSTLKALKQTVPTTGSLAITSTEWTKLETLFSQGIGNPGYFTKFDTVVATSNDSDIKSLHRLLQELFLICEPTFFARFKAKLECLSKIGDIDVIHSLPEKDKLTVFDINFLMSISGAIELLEKLNIDLVKGIDLLKTKLKALHALACTPFFEKLRALCLQSRPPGTIFLGDRHTVRALNGPDFSCTTTLQQLFMGRICHIGVFVHQQEKGLCLSHVNLITHTHAITPIRNPLVLPFSYALKLQANSLLPSTLPKEDHRMFIGVFSGVFQEMASVAHPELPLAGSKQHLRMLIMGHKTPFPTSLAAVDLPAKGVP